MSLPPSASTSEPRKHDLVLVGGGLDVAHELVERVGGGRRRPSRAISASVPLEAQERDRDDAVLRRLRAVAQVRAHAPCERQRGDQRRPAPRGAPVGRLVGRRGRACAAAAPARARRRAQRGGQARRGLAG